MDLQTAFNLAITLAGAMGGWILKTVWQAILALQKSDAELSTKHQQIEVLVAGSYPTRSEMEAKFDAIMRAVVRVEEKLDRKADK